ncbi:hypothetical protein ACIBF1_01750 [Spirillospora sp. NPDC050679]
MKVSERSWEGEPEEPLHVFDGRGDKVIALLRGLGEGTVVEFHRLSTFDASIQIKNRRLSRASPFFACYGGTIERASLARYGPLPGHVKIKTKGEWTLALLDPAGVPRFTDRYTGKSNDVCLYTGGFALARVTADGDDRDRLPGIMVQAVEGAHRDLLVHYSSGVVPLAGPTLLHVVGLTRWHVVVQPTDAARTFNREIKGEVNDVVRYTGPTGQVRIRHTQGLVVRLLDAELRGVGELLNERFKGESVVRLEEGAVLQIRADREEWRISVDA